MVVRPVRSRWKLMGTAEESEEDSEVAFVEAEAEAEAEDLEADSGVVVGSGEDSGILSHLEIGNNNGQSFW